MPSIAAPLSTTEHQWLYTPLELQHTPSIRLGFDPAFEADLRAQSVKRLMCLKDAMTTPQLVPTTAAAYVHRFYMRESFQDFPWSGLTAAAFFLASKVEENQRRLRDVVSASLDLEAGRPPILRTRDNPVNENAPEYIECRRKILWFEEALLRTLCFDLTVKQPYGDMLEAVGKIWTNKEVVQKVRRTAWPFITDSLPTTTSLIHRPHVIAAASIVLACAQLEMPLPGRPEPLPVALLELAREEGEEGEVEPYWVDLLGVEINEVKDAIERMTLVYAKAADPFVKAEAERTAKDAFAMLPTDVDLAPVDSANEDAPMLDLDLPGPPLVMNPSASKPARSVAPQPAPPATAPTQPVAAASPDAANPFAFAFPPAPQSGSTSLLPPPSSDSNMVITPD